jgi:hypothetical protein
VVATPTFNPVAPGKGKQQWMCDAVVPVSRPLSVTSTCSVLATGSSTAVAWPVPGEPVGGTSFVPSRVLRNVIAAASVAGAGNSYQNQRH